MQAVMHVTPSTSPRMAKSTSLGLLDHDGEMYIVDKDDIIGLTQDVKNFSDGLGRLKELFSEDIDGEEDLKVLAHERLGDVLCTLKLVLQNYPPLNTTELFSAAGTLIAKIKNYNYEEHSVEAMEGAFNDAIDQLALEFSSSVSEYLMGDLQHGVVEEVKTKSYDNLLSVSHESGDREDTEEEKEEPVVRLTPEQIDNTLMSLQAGLELAFQRAKAWSKYLKDVMSYIERRAQLEVEYSKNLSRLAASVKPALTEEGFLPLQSVYCTVLSQDVEYAKTCQATFTLLQTSKFVEPLSARRNEHDKVRKLLKEVWNKEVKKMQESINNLRKAQSLYVTRQQDYDKAKELSLKTESDVLSHSSSSSNLTAKIDKKKRAEDDASHKAAEAETTYKACVAEANNRQADLQRIKSEHLAAIRDQIFLSDQVIKKVTIDYFQLLQTVSAPVPVQYHTLCEASKRYEAGSQYAEFVRRLPVSTSTSVQYEEFKFEPFSPKGEVGDRKVSTQSNESETSDPGETSPNLGLARRQDKYRVPVRGAWAPQGIVSNSDTDSQSGSSKSLDSSPSNSPYPAGQKKMVLSGSMEDLIEDVPHGVKQLLAVPGTEQLDVSSIVKRQGMRRNTTFGVDFQEQVELYHSAIPPIISKCLKEVEKRGILVKGIYRVSGVKSTVENLCQRFESDPESVNLDSENPNVISNVLKLYLRQLPEPLLTFRLYQGFVQVAKENMSGGLSTETTIERLHSLIDNLPFSNRKTCGVLMHHLQRVAAHSEQNQMNASNLGIVFGPTLLRPQGGNASLACLVDTPHQTRVVELLIVHAVTLFGPMEDHQLIPGQTLVEPMEKRSTLQVPQPVTIELSKEDTARIEPRKESSPTISLSRREQLVHTSSSSSQVIDSPREPVPSKKQSEEILLPGSTSFDKKDLSTSRASSDGEETQADKGVEFGLDSQSEADDDDDDILLPDDSNRSKHEHETNRSGGGAVKKAGQRHFMTPPLATRHVTLRSPASSPNLSFKFAIPTTPTITIEESTSEYPNGTFRLGEDEFDGETATNEEPAKPASHLKVLPPVNAWVPKGESIFTSILDSRSPQIYRRTNPTYTKTLSCPTSPRTSLQSTRVSWPQASQTNPLETTPKSNLSDSSSSINEGSVKSHSSTSPKLLRKCTSFDHERSKPFPARSLMTSPMLLRKGTSLEDAETASLAVDNESKTLQSRLISDHTELKTGTSRIVYHEEDESIEKSEGLEIPQCSSSANVSVESSAVETIAGDNAVKYLVMSTAGEFDAAKASETLEYAQLHESSITFEKPNSKVDLQSQSKKSQSNHKLENLSTKDNSAGSELKDTGAKPKQFKQHPDKSKGKTESPVTAVKRKLKDIKGSRSQSAKMPSSKSGKDHPIKTSLSEKSPSKTPVSTVKSAILSSAAKLKSIGKKNPVTLLSYKSHSISIPDHSRKSTRPISAHEFSEGLTTKSSRIHQTESSPTVLMTVDHGVLDIGSMQPEVIKKQSSATPPVKVKKAEKLSLPVKKTEESSRSSKIEKQGLKKIDKPSQSLKKMERLTPPLKKSEEISLPSKKTDHLEKKQVSEKPPVLMSVQGLRKSAIGKTAAQSRTGKPTEIGTGKHSHHGAQSSVSPVPVDDKKLHKEKQSHVSPVHVDEKHHKEKQSDTTGTHMKVSSANPKVCVKHVAEQNTSAVSTAPKSARLTSQISGSSRGGKVDAKAVAKDSHGKEMPKFPQGKRGSVSSVNSDSSRTSDHFRDCCHGRKRTDKR